MNTKLQYWNDTHTLVVKYCSVTIAAPPCTPLSRSFGSLWNAGSCDQDNDAHLQFRYCSFNFITKAMHCIDAAPRVKIALAGHISASIQSCNEPSLEPRLDKPRSMSAPMWDSRREDKLESRIVRWWQMRTISMEEVTESSNQ